MLKVTLPGKHILVLKAGAFDQNKVEQKLQRFFGNVQVAPIEQAKADGMIAIKQQNLTTANSISPRDMQTLLAHIRDPGLRREAETFVKTILLNVYNGENPPVDEPVSMWENTARAIQKRGHRVLGDVEADVEHGEHELGHLAHEAGHEIEELAGDAKREFTRGKREGKKLAREAGHEIKELAGDARREFTRGEHELGHLAHEAEQRAARAVHKVEDWWETEVDPALKAAEHGAVKRARKAERMVKIANDVDPDGDIRNTSEWATNAADSDDTGEFAADSDEDDTNELATPGGGQARPFLRSTRRVRLRQRANVF